MPLTLVKKGKQAEGDSARNSIMEIPVAQIRPSPLNPRQDIDEEYLQRLAASIRQHGVIEPIIVRPVEDGYEVGPGKSRWLAAQIAERETVPAVVKENIDDLTWLQLMLAENLERKELNPIEEAQGFKELQKLGMKQGKIAELFHRSQPAIANYLRLLALPEKVQGAIRQGQLTTAHGVALASYAKFPKLVEKIADIAIERGMTSHALETPPQTWDLEQAGLIKRLRYEAVFDTKICERCPHGAYRQMSYTYYCLYPSHYQELQEAAVKERQEQTAAEAAKAKAKGKVAVRVRDLSPGSYTFLDRYEGTPGGCRDDCDKRVPGVGYDDRECIICIDTQCHQKLKAAETRAQNKSRRERGKDILRKVEETVDAITEISDRELVVLVMEVIKNRYSKHLKASLARLRCDDLAGLANPGPWVLGRPAYEIMGGFPRLTIVKAAIEAMLRQELDRGYLDQYSLGKLEPWATWYLREGGDSESQTEA